MGRRIHRQANHDEAMEWSHLREHFIIRCIKSSRNMAGWFVRRLDLKSMEPLVEHIGVWCVSAVP
jgi:hypothetical protein